jgi:hypothetical protein
MTIHRKFGRLFLIVTLVILVIGWLVVLGLSLYCALTLNCVSEVAGWWEVFLAVVAIPMLIYQLYSLRKAIQEGQWKPEIKVGLAVSLTDFSKLRSIEVLPSRVKLDLDSYFSLDEEQLVDAKQFNPDSIATPVVLVIRNQGKRAARFVKVRLSLVSFPGENPPILHAKGFSTLSDETTLVFRGGADWVIYPHDMELFHLGVTGKSAMSYHDRIGLFLMDRFLTDEQQRILAITAVFGLGDYDFRCTVWTEGQDGPVTEELRLTVMDSKPSERAEQLAQVLDQLESRCGVEASKDPFSPGGSMSKDVS